MFVGIGYDLHRLMPVRDLVLGGVKIPYERGLVGHSDADVLLHAVIDAILGAAAMGDIGQNFPDNDPEFKDVSSMELLAITWRMVQAKGFQLQNVDATILAEEPKMVPYKNQMRKNIADVLKLDIERVNVKAKTMEGLGAIGRREGIAVMAVAMLKMRKQDDI